MIPPVVTPASWYWGPDNRWSFRNMQRLFPVRVGETVHEQFELDLAVEHQAVTRLNAGIAACVTVGDNASRALLERILVAEEDHADWLETQLEAMRQVGEQNYLAQQLHD